MDIKTISVYAIWAFMLVTDVSMMNLTRADGGYSLGYMTECPGSEKEAIIEKRTLRYLSISVQTHGSLLMSERRRYNYYRMKNLAQDPDIDFSKMTILFAAGYMDHSNNLPSMSTGVLYKEHDYNVLLLDYSWFSTAPYPVASRFVPTVGKHTAEMLVELTKLGLDPKKLQLLGLSLGGQIVSFIAKHFKQQSGIKIGRVTGLDPSGPCFRNRGPEGRIDKSDADLVDIISTNVDGFGFPTPVGHVNFYVNGGEYQPGTLYWIYCSVFCSHARSLLVWFAALKYPNGFIAIQCDSVQQARDRQCYGRKPLVTNLVGLKMDPNKTGIFFVSTTPGFPFFMGKKGLKSENDFYMSQMRLLNNDPVMKM